MNSAVHGRRDPAWFCVRLVPNVVALRTPSQCTGGCGGFHRRAPTGGAPYGMQRKAVTPFTGGAPVSVPVWILIVWMAALGVTRLTAASAAAQIARRAIERDPWVFGMVMRA